MALMAPPRSPFIVTLADDGGNQLQLRLFQLTLTFITVVVTTWFVMLGPISAIIALAFAKHVLVAILVMGLGVDAKQA